MAVQQHKVSQSRKRKRRAHDALTPIQRTRCGRCNASALTHRICENCGFYRGKALVPVAEF